MLPDVDLSSNLGNSLSYVDSMGTTGSSTLQQLANVTLASNKEVVLMSGRSCDDGQCGYVRPGSVAYRKFTVLKSIPF